MYACLSCSVFPVVPDGFGEAQAPLINNKYVIWIRV
jgi:hypothetical protein